MIKSIGKFAVLLFFLILGIFLATHYDTSKPKPKFLKVTIELDNRCHVFDDAFVVKVNPTGQLLYFGDNLVETILREDYKVTLAASPAYPDFVYDGDQVNVAPKITLTTNCDPPDRINRTLDALREQFQN